MLRKVQVHSIVKRMLIVSFETHGVVRNESVPQGQSASQHYYADIITASGGTCSAKPA